MAGSRRPLRYPVPPGSLGLRPGPFYATWLGGDGGLRRRLAIAMALAVALHTAALGLSFLTPPPLPVVPPVLTQRVTLQKLPAPPLPPEPARPPQPTPTKAPAAAAAGRVLTAAPIPDRPLDMTSFDMAIGKGNVYAGGVTASSGTSLTAVTDSHASARGTGPSRARIAVPARTDWACAWPQEEEENTELHSVRVLIAVHVDRDGEAQSVDILGPAAAPFERAARQCALNELYFFAQDESGHAVASTTPPFSVHFVR
jgi:periplasmic protein TonB